MNATEQISYLKGLADGLGLDPENKQDKLIKAIIDVLDNLAATVSNMEDAYTELSEQVDAIDEDLSALEDDCYEDDDDDYDDDDGLEDSDFYEVKCPQCGDTIFLDEDMLDDGSMSCPNCDTELEFDFSCDCGCEDEECDCGSDLDE